METSREIKDAGILHQIIGNPSAQRAALVSSIVEGVKDDVDAEMEKSAVAGSRLHFVLTAIPIFLLDPRTISDVQRQILFSEAEQAIRVLSKRAQVRSVLSRLEKNVLTSDFSPISITNPRESVLLVPFGSGNIEVPLRKAARSLSSVYGRDEFFQAMVEGKNEGIDQILRVVQPEGISLQPFPLQVAREFGLLSHNTQGNTIVERSTAFKGIDVVYNYDSGANRLRGVSFRIMPV